jgi:hypothetical protein
MILHCADHDESFDTDKDVETHRFCKGTDGIRFNEPTSWRPMFLIGQDEWCGNAQRFATQEEAQASAQARFMVWTVPAAYRADPTDEPVNYRWDEKQGDVPLDRPEAAHKPSPVKL